MRALSFERTVEDCSTGSALLPYLYMYSNRGMSMLDEVDEIVLGDFKAGTNVLHWMHDFRTVKKGASMGPTFFDGNLRLKAANVGMTECMVQVQPRRLTMLEEMIERCSTGA